MAAPTQMFVHTLNPLKGWPSQTALDIGGKLHSAVTIDPLFAGRCVHVASLDPPTVTGGLNTPRYKTGVTGTKMGIFLFQNSNDPDVTNDGGTDWYAIVPTGVILGLVATGAYELETTEYDTALTYAPNEPLRAISADTDATTGGRLTNAGFVFGTTAYVGVVSRGTFTNAYGRSALAFWPVYAPTASA